MYNQYCVFYCFDFDPKTFNLLPCLSFHESCNNVFYRSNIKLITWEVSTFLYGLFTEFASFFYFVVYKVVYLVVCSKRYVDVFDCMYIFCYQFFRNFNAIIFVIHILFSYLLFIYYCFFIIINNIINNE